MFHAKIKHFGIQSMCLATFLATNSLCYARVIIDILNMLATDREIYGLGTT